MIFFLVFAIFPVTIFSILHYSVPFFFPSFICFAGLRCGSRSRFLCSLRLSCFAMDSCPFSTALFLLRDSRLTCSLAVLSSCRSTSCRSQLPHGLVVARKPAECLHRHALLPPLGHNRCSSSSLRQQHRLAQTPVKNKSPSVLRQAAGLNFFFFPCEACCSVPFFLRRTA